MTVQPPTREQIAQTMLDADSIAGKRDDYLRMADAVLALFPQPSTSTEPFPAECGRVMPHNPHNWSTEATLVPWEPRICSGAGTAQGRRMREHALSEQMYQHMMDNTQPAEPVSIADMAPETTCGRDVAGTIPSWAGEDQVSPCSCVLLTGHDGPHQCSHEVDPSTIRDVTPPPA